MSLEQIAFLVGLFVVPALLLALGQRLRRRRALWRRVFWGGVIGHSAALLVTLAAAHLPPVVWTGGPAWREVAVYWSLLLGAAVGAGIGAALPERRGSPSPGRG